MSNSCSPFDSIDYNLLISDSIDSIELSNFVTSNVGKYNSTVLNKVTLKINQLLSIYNKDNQRLSLKEKFVNIPFNRVEVADFLFYNNYSINSLLSLLTDYVTNYPIVDLVLSDRIEEVLDNLDGFTENSLGIKKDSNNFCASLSSVYSKLLKSTSLLQNVFNTVSDLANLNIDALIGSINIQLSVMKEMILTKIDNVIKKITVNIQNMLNQIMNFPTNVMLKLGKMINEVKMMFSGEGLQRLKTNIKQMINQMSSQFLVFTDETIMTLLMRMCQMMSFIEKLLNGKMNDLSTIINATENTTRVLSRSSNGRINIINSLGIPMLNYDNRRAEIERFITSSNEYVERDAAGSIALPSNFGGYISLTNASQEEQSWLNSINTKTANSNSGGLLSFGDGILKMAQRAHERLGSGQGDSSYWREDQNFFDTEAGIDAGLENVRINEKMPLVRIRRVAQMMNSQLSLNSAYRSDFYQSTLSGEKAAPGSSPHRTGYALDVSPSWNDDEGSKFVEMCSREGFIRIAIYPGERFFHIDFHPQNNWSKTLPSAGNALGPKTASAMQSHLNGVFR